MRIRLTKAIEMPIAKIFKPKGTQMNAMVKQGQVYVVIKRRHLPDMQVKLEPSEYLILK